MSKGIRATLLAGAVVFGASVAATGPAWSLLFVGPSPSDFVFSESEGPDGGYYTIANHSSDWWVYGLSVTNPEAGDPFTASTTQPNWQASTCVGADNCFDNQSGFHYEDYDYTNLNLDITPGHSSSNFFFSAPEASVPGITLVNGEGQTASLTPLSVPEPATWALLLTGFGALGLAAHASGRRTARASAPSLRP